MDWSKGLVKKSNRSNGLAKWFKELINRSLGKWALPKGHKGLAIRYFEDGLNELRSSN